MMDLHFTLDINNFTLDVENIEDDKTCYDYLMMRGETIPLGHPFLIMSCGCLRMIHDL